MIIFASRAAQPTRRAFKHVRAMHNNAIYSRMHRTSRDKREKGALHRLYFVSIGRWAFIRNPPYTPNTPYTLRDGWMHAVHRWAKRLCILFRAGARYTNRDTRLEHAGLETLIPPLCTTHSYIVTLPERYYLWQYFRYITTFWLPMTWRTPVAATRNFFSGVAVVDRFFREREMRQTKIESWLFNKKNKTKRSSFDIYYRIYLT